MNQNERREILQRLESAWKRSQEAFEKTEKGRDLHQGTQIANWWMFMAAGYSGIEQSFKCIIAMERGMTIGALLKEKQTNFRTHDLGDLFDQISEDTKQVLNEYYERFQSLHNYIKVERLCDFLKEASGAGGRGYEQWRYALIEPGPIPRGNVDCMLAIWYASVQLIENTLYPSRSIWMPDRELLQTFESVLQDAWDEVYIRRQNAEMDVPDDVEELNRWRESYDHPINAYASLFWNHHRGMISEYAGGSDWLVELFCEWAERITRPTQNGIQTGLLRFAGRAKGNTRTGIGVRWDVEKNRFENVSWNLDQILAESVPGTAKKVQWGIDETRDKILSKMHREGFDVRECRSYGGEQEDKEWSCTMVAEKIQASEEKLILEVWERAWSSDIYVNLKGAASKEIDDVQKWIRSPSHRH